MAILGDVQVGSLSNDERQMIHSIVKQVNEWARQVSNEDLVKIYKDQSGTNRRMVGLLPDGTIGIRVSKEGVDVVSASDTELIYKDDFSTQTFYDDSDPRILIGFQSGGF